MCPQNIISMSKNAENWLVHFEDLKAYVKQTGHFPGKHTALNNWVKYQRKRMKAGTMPERQRTLFLQLSESRGVAAVDADEEDNRDLRLRP